MSAEQVSALEDMLGRIERNRAEPGLRLRLPFERVGAPEPRPSAPTAARAEAEPPSTKDFGERPGEEAAASGVPAGEPAAAAPPETETPEVIVDSRPEIVAVEEEIIIDEASHDVYIEDDDADEPLTLSRPAPETTVPTLSAEEPEAITSPKPTQVQLEGRPREEAMAAARREPVTEPRPERTATPEAPEPTPATAVPPTKVSVDSEPGRDADAITTKRKAKEEAAARAAAAAAPSAAAPSAAAPSAAAPSAAAPSAAAPSAAAPSAAAPSAAAPEKKPPPFPGATTEVSGRSPVAEAEIETPPPPEAAPAIAERHAIKPVVIEPQIVASANVAELIGEIAALGEADFGTVLDGSLSLEL